MTGRKRNTTKKIIENGFSLLMPMNKDKMFNNAKVQLWIFIAFPTLKIPMKKFEKSTDKSHSKLLHNNSPYIVKHIDTEHNIGLRSNNKVFIMIMLTGSLVN